MTTRPNPPRPAGFLCDNASEMKIIAHRGASAERPENTLAAFERAIEIGVDAIECDLLMSREGRMVVRHDDLIRRGGRWVGLGELTFEELQTLDVGGGERIPSLESLYDLLYPRCPLVLDLKQPGLAGPLAAFLTQRRALERTHVTSFLWPELEAIRRECPGLEWSFTCVALPPGFLKWAKEAGVRMVSLSRQYVDEPTLRQLQGAGLQVRAYPVNRPEEAKRFSTLGLEGIYTDDPAGCKR